MAWLHYSFQSGSQRCYVQLPQWTAVASRSERDQPQHIYQPENLANHHDLTTAAGVCPSPGTATSINPPLTYPANAP